MTIQSDFYAAMMVCRTTYPDINDPKRHECEKLALATRRAAIMTAEVERAEQQKKAGQ